MKVKLSTTLASLIFVASTCSRFAMANVFVPSDVPYRTIQHGSYIYVFPDDYREWIPQVIHLNQLLTQHYEKSYNWKLDETSHLVLGSHRNQVANGFATTTPNIFTVFYPSGAGLLDRFASSSWLNTLLVHETAHLYQLNAKGNFNAQLKKYLGNPLFFMTPIGLPLFVHPNIFTPTFLLEGNATFVESQFGFGGRLYSGEVRALVFALAKENILYAPRLINDHLDFPFGNENYLVGGYFNYYLSLGGDHAQVNSIYKSQGGHVLNPLRLDPTFQEHYLKSTNLLFREFRRWLELQAEGQQTEPGQVFELSLLHSKMNNDKDHIYFLSAGQARSTPDLIVINKSDRTLERKKIDLPYGKVFKINNKYYTGSSQLVDSRHITYSLFGPGLQYLERFSSQIVQDLRGGHSLSISAVNSFLEPQLLLDGKKITTAHSSAILDENGNYYYFRQDGDTRKLYKNDKALVSFQGFYAKPMEVNELGEVFFVSATPYGSSLFKFSPGNKQLHRVSRSDRLVDARQLNDKEFVITEISVRGYEYKVIRGEQIEEIPFKYQYEFEDNNLSNLFDQAKENIPPLSSYKVNNYSSLWNMQFSGVDAGLFFTYSGLAGFASTLFVDPLNYNSLRFSYSRGEYKSQLAAFEYYNSKKWLNWYLGYLYNESTVYDILTEEVVNTFHDNQAYAGVLWPFYHRRRLSSALQIEASYESDDFNSNETNRREVGLFSSLNFRWERSYPLNFKPYRLYSIEFSHKIEAEEKSWKKSGNISAVYSTLNFGLPYQNFLSLFGGVGFAEDEGIQLSYQSLRDRHNQFQRLTPGASLTSREVRSAGLSYSKAFDVSAYLSRVPLSLRRLAPAAIYQYFDRREDDEFDDLFDRSFSEWFVGVDLELLLLHKIPIRLKLGKWDDTLELESHQWMFDIRTQTDF